MISLGLGMFISSQAPLSTITETRGNRKKDLYRVYMIVAPAHGLYLPGFKRIKRVWDMSSPPTQTILPSRIISFQYTSPSLDDPSPSCAGGPLSLRSRTYDIAESSSGEVESSHQP